MQEADSLQHEFNLIFQIFKDDADFIQSQSSSKRCSQDNLECKRAEARRSVDCPRGEFLLFLQSCAIYLKIKLTFQVTATARTAPGREPSSGPTAAGRASGAARIQQRPAGTATSRFCTRSAGSTSKSALLLLQQQRDIKIMTSFFFLCFFIQVECNKVTSSLHYLTNTHARSKYLVNARSLA